MNPAALPPALADLLLPEAKVDQSTTGSGTGPSDDGGSPERIDRFERYLSSARHSVLADQPLPTMARPDDSRSVVARKPIDRRSAPTRSGSGPDNDPRADDRAIDRAANRDRPRSDTEPERIEDRSRIDRTGTERSDGTDERVEAPDDGTTDDATAPVSSTEATETTVSADAATTTVDVEGELPAEAELVAEADIDLELAEQIGAGDATTDPDAGEAEAASEADATTALVDQAAVMAAAAAVATEQTRSERSGDAESTSVDDTIEVDQTIDLDQEQLVDPESGQAGDGDGAESADASVAPADDPSTTGAGEGDGVGQDQAVAGARPTTEARTDAGPGLAPVATAAANQRSTTGPTQTGGAEAITGAAAPRARTSSTTTTTTTTPAAQAAAGGEVEGEGGDPLWLQVRRAMSSLRTLQNGEQQVTIRLRPAELGSVVVRVNAGETGTSVSLLADSAVAATQLTQQRQLLVSELEQSGLVGVAVDVDTGQNPDGPETGPSDGEGAGGQGDGTAAAAALAGAGNSGPGRTGGRGGRARGSSSGLVDVDL